MATNSMQGPPVATMTIGSVRTQLKEATSIARTSCGPLSKLAQAPLDELGDALDLVESAALSWGRKCSRDLQLRAYRDREQPPPPDLVATVQSAARDAVVKNWATKAEAAADGYLTAAKAFRDSIEATRLKSEGPSALRSNRDLAAILKLASLREDLQTRPAAEIRDLFSGLAERGDAAADDVADAAEPVLREIVGMTEPQLQKKVGPRSVTQSSILARRSGDFAAEQAAAIDGLSKIAAYRRAAAPAWLAACDEAFVRMTTLATHIVSFNVWSMPDSALGLTAPRTTINWRDPLNVDPAY